jgi:hypothetical protein
LDLAWVFAMTAAGIVPASREVRLKGTHNTLTTSNRVDVDAFLVWP